MCAWLADDVLRLSVTSKVQCGEGPSNLNSQFGDLTYAWEADADIYCDSTDKMKSNACIRKIQPFTSKRTKGGQTTTEYDYISDIKYTDSDGVTDDVEGLAINEYAVDYVDPGTEYDFGEGCLVGISAEYFESNLFRVKFHYADGFVKDESCNLPEPVVESVDEVVEDEKTGAILMKAGLASLTLAAFASV